MYRESVIWYGFWLRTKNADNYPDYPDLTVHQQSQHLNLCDLIMRTSIQPAAGRGPFRSTTAIQIR